MRFIPGRTPYRGRNKRRNEPPDKHTLVPAAAFGWRGKSQTTQMLPSQTVLGCRAGPHVLVWLLCSMPLGDSGSIPIPTHTRGGCDRV